MIDPPLYVMLVGVPGAGKTTFRETMFNQGYKVYSSDLEIEKLCKELGKTYNELFADYYIECVEKAENVLDEALEKGYDVVDDHTNLTVASRQRRLRVIPDYYTKIAIVFNPPPEDEYRRRLASRPGKVIPEPVIKNMLESFTAPTTKEGFDYVAVIQ